jgi:cytochrome c oxidase subunit II
MAETMTSLSSRIAAVALIGAGLWVVVPRSAAQEAPSNQRGLTVVARKYAFEPARLEVNLNDLVKVTLSSPDIAHSFTVDAYRIAKRVGGGQTVTFEFRADRPGSFPVYCNLRQDDRCRQMHGLLVVHAK